LVPFATASIQILGPIQSFINFVLWVFYPGVKQPGHEDDHSPPSTAQVKKMWSYSSTPPYVFMAFCLIMRRIHLYVVVLS
jgi:hypothetical protein